MTEDAGAGNGPRIFYINETIQSTNYRIEYITPYWRSIEETVNDTFYSE